MKINNAIGSKLLMLPFCQRILILISLFSDSRANDGEVELQSEEGDSF